MAPVIEAIGLTKKFGTTTALDGLDLTVHEGEVHGFLGPNGAGKSTTIRVLLGLLRSDGGTVTLLGRDPWKDATELHRQLAYVPGDVVLWPNLTGGEVIDLLGRLRGGIDEGRRAELLEAFELDPTKKGRSYSKGNRQKVALVAALAADVELLILDEPTSGLDPLMEEAFRECIEERRAAGTDDRDPVGEPLDLAQDVAGEQDRRPLGLVLGEALVEHLLHQRVQSGGRLVEQEQLDRCGERGDQGDLLAVALRVRATALGGVEAEPLEQLAAASRSRRHATHPQQEVDDLAAGQVGPQVHVARDVGEPAVQVGRVLPRVPTEQSHLAGVGAQQAEQDSEGGGLAGAVGAEEAVHLPPSYLQVETVEGERHSEPLHQTSSLHDCRAHDANDLTGIFLNQ